MKRNERKLKNCISDYDIICEIHTRGREHKGEKVFF